MRVVHRFDDKFADLIDLTATGSRVSSGSGLRSLVASSTMCLASWVRSSFRFLTAQA